MTPSGSWECHPGQWPGSGPSSLAAGGAVGTEAGRVLPAVPPGCLGSGSPWGAGPISAVRREGGRGGPRWPPEPPCSRASPHARGRLLPQQPWPRACPAPPGSAPPCPAVVPTAGSSLGSSSLSPSWRCCCHWTRPSGPRLMPFPRLRPRSGDRCPGLRLRWSLGACPCPRPDGEP